MIKHNTYLPDTIIIDTIISDEGYYNDTLIYTDGADTIYEIDDSIYIEDSLATGLRLFEKNSTFINVTFGSTNYAINPGLYGIHIGGMFDNSTLPNDGTSNYGWQWLVDLGPNVLRFPQGSYSKFTHLLHDPYSGNNAIGYGYNLFEIAKYFDWSDDTMDFDFNALSSADINHILNDDKAELESWINFDDRDHFINYRNKCLAQSCETRRYIDDFIALAHQINLGNPGKPVVKVILDLNILSETATECRAIADYLVANGVPIGGIEMGNETYANYYCNVMGFDTFDKYYNYINGTNLPGNENVLNNVAGTSNDMWGDHDFITKLKTGAVANYKIGVCGMPLGPDYAFRLNDILGGACAISDDWNNSLRARYSEQVTGTSKFKFDAVIMHTYYESDIWGYIPINNLTSVTCTGFTDLWHFDVYDTRLQTTFNDIVSGPDGNFRDFITKTTPEYKSYQVAFDKFNTFFSFDLLNSSKKELWTTEWNLKDGNKNYNDVELAKAGVYSNGFLNGHLVLQWWLKNIKINNSGNLFRQNFYTYATIQNYAGGTSTDLISISDAIERDYYGIDDCPYSGSCGDGCVFDATADQRNYHIRRVNYYTTYLISEIFKKNLKYLPSTFKISKNNINIQPTIFIDATKENVYVYFSNVKNLYQDFDLYPDNLLSFFPGANYLALGEATVTYLQGDQLYSTTGKSSLYDKTLINTCYASNNHPFEIKSATEAGVFPAIVTEANIPQYTGSETPINGCLSAPPYSFGYFKVPISGLYIAPKLLGSTHIIDVSIYPNPSATAFSIMPIFNTYENNAGVFNVSIIGLDGIVLLHTSCAQNQQIDISKLAAGCYQICIVDENNNRFLKKLIKTNSYENR